MIRFALASLFAVTLVSPVAAQTVAFRIDLAQFDAIRATQVEDDGNPATPKAWLLRLRPTGGDLATARPRYQLLVPTASGMCEEAPFHVGNPAATILLEEQDGRKVLQVYEAQFFVNASSDLTVHYLDRKLCK